MSRPPQAFRPFWALAPIGVLYFASLLRLLSLQGHLTQEDASSFVRRTTVLPAPRGAILDRYGRVLAEDVQSWDLVLPLLPKDRGLVQAAESGRLQPAELRAKIETLAEGVGVPFAKLWQSVLTNPSAAQVLRRGLAPAQRETIAQLLRQIPGSGLSLRQEFRRVCPNGPVLSHLLGYPRGEDEGGRAGMGLELGLEPLLQGVNGFRRAIGVSRKHGVNPALDMEPPKPGLSVRTTLDAELSAFARAQLVDLLEQHPAESCFAIVVDVNNGQILSLEGLPDYDPQNPLASMEVGKNPYTGAEELRGWKFPGLDFMAPGSTFKPLVAAYALNRGAIDYQQRFENFHGRYLPPHRLQKHVIHNADGVPDEPMRAFEGIVYSSNVVFAQIARAIGREGMASMLDAFGYHAEKFQLPGLALTWLGYQAPSGEEFLRERSPDGMAYPIPNMGYGQGIQVSPLDHAMALASIANGGWLLQPTLDPQAAGKRRRILQEEPTRYVREAMHAMVMLPHRKWLPHREELAYCGKSGTAQIRSGPFLNRYTSLFTAFGPADDPQLLVLVVAYGTQKSQAGGLHHYGSRVCGPAAANILHWALQQRGLLAKQTAPNLEWRASAANLRRE